MRCLWVAPDAPDRELLRGWQECLAAATADGYPLPAPVLDEVEQAVRHPGGPPIARFDLLLATGDDGRVLGGTEVWWLGGANAHRVEHDPVVHPAARRRGVGRALVEATLEAAGAAGRRTVVGAAPVDSGGTEFGAATGARLATVERRNLLTVDPDHPVVPAPLAGGYRFERFVDVPPPGLLEPLARCQAAMNDAPTGELDMVDEDWSVERVAATYAIRRLRGATTHVVVAVAAGTGEVAGLTEVVSSAWHPERAEQGDTCVAPEHRGQGIGLALKTEMLRWLRTELPELRTIDTWNDDANSPMLDVNHAMGYVLGERWAILQWATGA